MTDEWAEWDAREHDAVRAEQESEQRAEQLHDRPPGEARCADCRIYPAEHTDDEDQADDEDDRLADTIRGCWHNLSPARRATLVVELATDVAALLTPTERDAIDRIPQGASYAQRRADELADARKTRPGDHLGGPVLWDPAESGHATP